jgi:catechol 2,3-dioxygenase-like lactoylglutathione lyase family enzyme
LGFYLRNRKAAEKDDRQGSTAGALKSDKGVVMRTTIAFLSGALLGSVLVAGQAQGLRLTGENYLNHVAIAVENFDAAFAFYTQKLGFREAFTVRDANGRPTLAYVQVSRNTFIELQQANANRPPGLNHFGLHVENLKSAVDTFKQRAVMVEDPRVRPDDSSVANATDPNGIRIEMFEFGPGSPQGKAIASWK